MACLFEFFIFTLLVRERTDRNVGGGWGNGTLRVGRQMAPPVWHFIDADESTEGPGRLARGRRRRGCPAAPPSPHVRYIRIGLVDGVDGSAAAVAREGVRRRACGRRAPRPRIHTVHTARDVRRRVAVAATRLVADPPVQRKRVRKRRATCQRARAVRCALVCVVLVLARARAGVWRAR